MSPARRIAALAAAAIARRSTRVGGAARGFLNVGSSGTSGWGSSAAATSSTTVAVATILAHQRHRGEGSAPVGVSMATKPMQATMRMVPLL
jgi:hypothetical protein